MTPEFIKKIIENLKSYGFEPKSENNLYTKTIVHYSNSYIIFNHDESNLTINLSAVINYVRVFDKDDVDYLTNKGINDWSIYRGRLELTYSTNDILDLEETLKELLKEYE